ncbi:amidase [Paenibacillus alvei]
MVKDFGAFAKKEVVLEPLNTGELSGLSFAVKDVFAIKGHQSTAGNPDWLKTHPAAASTAFSLSLLLNNGARLEGTTITDELMYSLNGENFYYGTPINPKDPKRIPGGSSCGSAVAVAAELTDFAIGTDTGGSVRIPSSYSGIYGIRPTHNIVDMEGVIPLAKSFDTVGWMARDAETLRKVGNVLIKEEGSREPFTRILMADDAWELIEPNAKEALLTELKKWQTASLTHSQTVLANEGLADWAETFRMLQGREIWEEHGKWIEKYKPSFGPGIAERFQWASTLAEADMSPFIKKRRMIQENMEKLLKDDGLLIIPTSPGKAPLLNLSVEELELRRSRTFQLCCIAGLTGFPQVNIPLAEVDGVPVGVSVIAGKGQDKKLLQFIASLEANKR